MQVRLPEPRARRRGVLVRSGLQVRPELQLQGVVTHHETKELTMPFDARVLAVVGSLCLLLALVLAWCLVGVRSSQFMKRCFPNYQYLLKSHLDFLMMTGLLFIFFLLFAHLRITPPAFIVVTMSVGSLANPTGFLALAIKPDLPQQPVTAFGALMALSFTATTIGYGGAALYFSHVVIHGAARS